MGVISTIGRHASGVEGIGVVAVVVLVTSEDTLGTKDTMTRGELLQGVRNDTTPALWGQIAWN